MIKSLVKEFMLEQLHGAEKKIATWNHHNSYQWAYFGENIKQRIEYFLASRARGRNLDVGGGWYLHTPDSVVLDISSKGLKYNPSKRKVLFDMDSLGRGESLPFQDGSFDSATFISAWQYLEYPELAVRELQRVVMPGGEVYIINGQGAGLDGFTRTHTTSQGISGFFQKLGFDTIVEVIPTYDEDQRRFTDTFQSVCVAMPEPNLFGENISAIRNKSTKKDRVVGPEVFEARFKEFELNTVLSLLEELSTHPVTSYSKEYLDRIEQFSRDHYRATGKTAFIFADHSSPAELDLTLPEHHIIAQMFLFERYSSEGEEIYKHLSSKHDLRLGRVMGYFYTPFFLGELSPERLLDYCSEYRLRMPDIWSNDYESKAGNERQLKAFVSFIAAIPLTAHTSEFQQMMYGSLQQNIPDLDARIERQKAFAYHMLTTQYKQRRNIVDLIGRKQQIERGGLDTIDTGTIDLNGLRPFLREFIA